MIDERSLLVVFLKKLCLLIGPLLFIIYINNLPETRSD